MSFTSENKDIKKIGIGEYKIGKDNEVLKSSGLGSCVGVIIYDPKKEVGGLLHAMLPSFEEMNSNNKEKFVDSGVEEMFQELRNMGARVDDMEAKLAGGSRMLDFSREEGDIGDRNITSAREKLDELDIDLVGEDVGEDYGRSIVFDLKSKDLVVKSAKKEDRVI